eukprot:237910-Prymnesium_polylepis.2
MSRPALTSKRSQSVHSMPVAPALFFGAAIGSEKETKGSARLMKAFLYALRCHARTQTGAGRSGRRGTQQAARVACGRARAAGGGGGGGGARAA